MLEILGAFILGGLFGFMICAVLGANKEEK